MAITGCALYMELICKVEDNFLFHHHEKYNLEWVKALLIQIEAYPGILLQIEMYQEIRLVTLIMVQKRRSSQNWSILVDKKRYIYDTVKTLYYNKNDIGYSYDINPKVY